MSVAFMLSTLGQAPSFTRFPDFCDRTAVASQ